MKAQRTHDELIAFVQPFGLSNSGGGSRILSRLIEAAPVPVVSVATCLRTPRPTTLADEVHLPVRPHLGRIEQTRFSSQIDRFERLYSFDFLQRLLQLCLDRGVTAIHAVAHNASFRHAFEAARRLGLPFYLTVHDDLSYNMHGSPKLKAAQAHLRTAWQQADGRTVISEAMGQEYNRRYGERPYVVVTDGLDDTEHIASQPRPAERRRVYFMGMLHVSYEPNFKALVAALEAEQRAHPEREVSFIIRGGLSFPLKSPTLPIEVRGWGTQADIEADFAEVDVLYLPLPFDPAFEDFVRYSLSTKMVTYLGSGLPILYHGPQPAAAGDLLARHEAAAAANSLDTGALRAALRRAAEQREALVEGAARLSRARFDMGDLRADFWETLSQKPEAAQPPPAGGSSSRVLPQRRSYDTYSRGERLAQRLARRLRQTASSAVLSHARRWWWGAQGMNVGEGTTLPRLHVTWPHQVHIGKHCTLEPHISFKYDGYWHPGPSIVIGDHVFVGHDCEFNISAGIEIGDNSLIASGCRFVDHNHNIQQGALTREQHAPAAPIVLEADVWLGVNVTVLQGVRIGRGAIVGTGSVVTTSIPPNELWAGTPARKIKDRPPGLSASRSTVPAEPLMTLSEPSEAT